MRGLEGRAARGRTGGSRETAFMKIKQKPKALNKCQISPSISCVVARIKVIKYTKGPSRSTIKLSYSHSSSSKAAYVTV